MNNWSQTFTSQERSSHVPPFLTSYSQESTSAFSQTTNTASKYWNTPKRCCTILHRIVGRKSALLSQQIVFMMSFGCESVLFCFQTFPLQTVTVLEVRGAYPRWGNGEKKKTYIINRTCSELAHQACRTKRSSLASFERFASSSWQPRSKNILNSS